MNLKRGEKRLNKTGLIFIRTALGEGVFIPEEDVNENYIKKSVRPREWTVAQLKAVAFFMKKNPNCTKFDDGSGEPVKMK